MAPMPWPAFRHKPDDELWAIIAYVKHGIKPVNNAVPAGISATTASLTAHDTSTIKAFAGERPDVAVVPTTVQAMMASYDSHVVHYEVADTYEPR